MRTISTATRPAVRAAIVALDAFGATHREEATALIGLWARYDELSDTDVIDVVNTYPDTEGTAQR